MKTILSCSGLGLLLFLILCCVSCANPISPDGGPRDEEPPKIVEEKSTPNLQTNFRPEEIRLTFDEWVRLQDVRQQVIISPPLSGYTVNLKGRTVIVDLGDTDTLRSNVTYVIQFGEAVKDLTENNPAENLRFVFSTGPYIDSLEVRGQVLDAYTDEPVEDALVMLYENLADSVVRTERPFYFGRTGETGQFLISNVREGTFKVFALLDADGNYRFNQVNEQIGFLLDPIVVSSDSIPPVNIRLFAEQLPLQRRAIDTATTGHVKLTYNQPPQDLLEVETGATEVRQAFDKDTFHLWHHSPEAWQLLLASDTTYTDTFRIKAASLERAGEFLDTLRMLSSSRGGRQNPGRPLSLRFSRPLQSLDTAQVRLLEDSLLTPKTFRWEVDTLDPRRLRIQTSWKEAVPYRWVAPPGSIVDYWGQTNLDTLRMGFQTDERQRFGNFRIRFSEVDSAQAYVVRLIGSGDNLMETFRISAGGQLDYSVNALSPGTYRLEVIKDDNANGRWDPGSYDGRRLPEQVRIRELEELRANWDVEAAVELAPLFN